MKTPYFLIAIVLILLFFMVELFNPFLKAIIVSILLTISTVSLNIKMQKYFKYRVVSSSVLTILMAALFFLPILYCILSFVSFFNKVDQQLLISNLDNFKEILHSLAKDFAFLDDFFKKIISSIDVGKSVQQLFSISTFLGKNSAKFMIDMVMILIFFFFFTLYSKEIANFLKVLLPIKMKKQMLCFTNHQAL